MAADNHDRALALLGELEEATAEMVTRPSPYGPGPNVAQLVCHHTDAIRKMVQLHRVTIHGDEPTLGLDGT